MAEDLLNELNDADESVDLIDGLTDEDDLPSYWDPEPGEGVQGIVVKLVNATTRMGPAPVVVLRQKNGEEIAVWGLRKLIRDAIEDDEPQPGDLWAVKYFGEKKSKNGETTYHSYKTAIRRGAAKPTESGSKPPPF